MFEVNRDRLAGLIYLGIALAGFWSGWDLPQGTLSAIGSGFLPKVTLMLLGGIGVVKLVASFIVPSSNKVALRLPRALVLLVLSIVSFGMLVDRAGLILAVVAMAVFVDLAGNHSPKGGMPLLYIIVGLIAFSVVVFSRLLGIPLELLPSWN
jgi:putative tricarboxylic transport membrane protein